MRSTSLIAGALAVAATTIPFGAGGAAQAGESTTTHERGIVVECTGTVHGRDVFASLYENDTFGNTIQVVIGHDGEQVGGSRSDADGFRSGRQVRGALRVDGSRALITGTARRIGDRTPVNETYDDAGQRITTTGFHRDLLTRVTITWQRRTAPLDCGTAFRYDLTVVKEPIV